MKPSVIFKKLHDYLTDKDYRVIFNSHRGFYNKMDDKEYLKLMSKTLLHKELNLDNPQTYSDKMQWLKLHDRRPEYTTMVDKYAVKEYVAKLIGKDHIIPTLGVWEHFDDIDFDKLPNQFVLKCTHDSGSLIICKDKNKFNKTAARKQIEGCLKHNYFYYYREWPYKNVKPRIIAEKYMTPKGSDALIDYKFFCFNGIPKIMYYSKDKANDPRTDFFDMEYNHLPIRMRDQNSDTIPPKPLTFETMKTLASQLSAGFPHVRIDFYEIEGKIYFGEFTFYHCSGFTDVKPKEWDYKLGSWIELPKG